MRSVFFGTPAIAVPALEALAGVSTVLGVVCQPDRPKGRGLQLAAPDVKLAAQRLGLPVYQPLKVRDGELAKWLQDLQPDVAVVLAYGRILPPDVLAIPKHGCLNLHASLLPAYRGAAPINWALIHGQSQSGLSLMKMEEGLDTGPVFTSRVLPLDEQIDAGELSQRMAQLAAQMVKDDVPRVVSGELKSTAQDHTQASHAPPLTSEHQLLDCNRSARSVVNQVRGLSPRPGTRCSVGGRGLKVLRVQLAEEHSQGEPGRVLIADKGGIVVQANPGTFSLLLAQPEGKKVLSASDLVNGRYLKAGDRLQAPRADGPSAS
jgi:methionyl-tRNA formyltransferase